VCALARDIGDLLGPAQHAELGAAILRPYISEQNSWMLEKHGIFQGHYFFHHIDLDRDARDRFRSHPWFEYTAEFCCLYDQNSFDPNYDSIAVDLRGVNLSSPTKGAHEHGVWTPVDESARWPAAWGSRRSASWGTTGAPRSAMSSP
jgi:hypothetical protein